MNELRGWLLDLYADEADGLVLWLLADDGRRLRLTQQFPITFYAHGPFPRLRALWRFLQQQPAALAGVPPSQLHLSRVTRQDLFAGPLDVLAVEVANPAWQPRLFRQVARWFPDLTYYDADIPLGLRYAAVSDVFPLCYCELVVDENGRIQHITPLESRWDMMPSQPPLKILTIEPNEDPSHREPKFLWVDNGHFGLHSYSYGALNRLESITRPDEAVSFTYDAVGNRLTMDDDSGITTYSYDALYRLTQVTDPFSQTVQYGYDAVGNRASLVYPGGDSAIYTYDAANRLQTVTDWDAGITQYDYDEIGRLVQMVLPNSVSSNYAYDDADPLTRLQHTHAVSGTLAEYGYSYDLVGNRIQAVKTVVSPGVSAPTAVFTGTPLAGTAPLIVTFFNDSLNADTFIWDFGDGNTLTTTQTAPITYTYSSTGVYTVSLTAQNDQFNHTQTRGNYIQVVPTGTFQESDGLLVMEAETPM